MINSALSLREKYILKKIFDYVNIHKDVTRTSIIRRLNIEETIVDRIISYAVSRDILIRGAYNKFNTNKNSFSIKESDYYDMIFSSINLLWLNEGFLETEFYVENTSREDSKIVGPWTRPDFTLLSFKKFPWTIGSEFDVVTFEIKRPETANVLAVFEALSHASAATRAYVVFPLDQNQWERGQPEQSRRVKEECLRHGVGLILIEDVIGEARPIHLISALRREIDHEKCSNFLDSVISNVGKSRIAGWKN